MKITKIINNYCTIINIVHTWRRRREGKWASRWKGREIWRRGRHTRGNTLPRGRARGRGYEWRQSTITMEIEWIKRRRRDSYRQE